MGRLRFLNPTFVCVLVAQWCPTLCNPMDCSPPRLPCPWNSSGKNTGVGCHSLLQGIFPTQGSNLGLLQADYLPSEPSGKPVIYRREHFIGGLRCLNPTFIQVYYLWIAGKTAQVLPGNRILPLPCTSQQSQGSASRCTTSSTEYLRHLISSAMIFAINPKF